MTNRKKSKSALNVGVDIGKSGLDVCIHEKGVHWQDENTPQGINRILKRLSYYKIERLVMEATGRYEFELAQTAYQKQIPACIVKPLRIRKFAGARDILAKIDKLDAKLITDFAATVCPDPTPAKSKSLITIKYLIARRRQLMTMRTQEMNRTTMYG